MFHNLVRYIIECLLSMVSIFPNFINALHVEILEDTMDALSNVYEKKGQVYHNTHYSEKNRNELMSFLISSGVPENAIDLGCPVEQYFHDYAFGLNPDLSIVDSESLQPLAFFRIFDDFDDYKKDMEEDGHDFYGAFYHYHRRTKNKSIVYEIPYYLVWKENEKLVFIDIRHIYSQSISPSLYMDHPLSYGLLKSNCEHRQIRKQRINKKKLLSFWKLAFALVVPIACIVLLVLDAKGIYPLTTERLIVVGIILCSLLIPYLTQVSIKDFSFEFSGK